MPLWVSLIEANYDMRRYAASGDAGKRLISELPVVGRRCLLSTIIWQLERGGAGLRGGRWAGRRGWKEKRESSLVTDQSKDGNVLECFGC